MDGFMCILHLAPCKISCQWLRLQKNQRESLTLIETAIKRRWPIKRLQRWLISSMSSNIPHMQVVERMTTFSSRRNVQLQSNVCRGSMNTFLECVKCSLAGRNQLRKDLWEYLPALCSLLRYEIWSARGVVTARYSWLGMSSLEISPTAGSRDNACMFQTYRAGVGGIIWDYISESHCLFIDPDDMIKSGQGFR